MKSRRLLKSKKSVEIAGGKRKTKKTETKKKTKVGRGESRKERVVHKTKSGARYVVRRSKTGKVRREYLKKRKSSKK